MYPEKTVVEEWDVAECPYCHEEFTPKKYASQMCPECGKAVLVYPTIECHPDEGEE